MKTGIEFKYTDGSTEDYDPIQDFKTTDLNYEFWIGGYTYQIPIDNVLELREYPLCDVCGHEDSDDGCKSCAEKEEIRILTEKK